MTFFWSLCVKSINSVTAECQSAQVKLKNRHQAARREKLDHTGKQEKMCNDIICTQDVSAEQDQVDRAALDRNTDAVHTLTSLLSKQCHKWTALSKGVNAPVTCYLMSSDI